MIKFNRSNTHDLYAIKQRTRKQDLSNTSRHTVSSSEELEPPKHISLESLKAFISAAESGIESPKSISLESLIAYSNSDHEMRSETPEEATTISLEDLKTFLTERKKSRTGKESSSELSDENNPTAAKTVTTITKNTLVENKNVTYQHRQIKKSRSCNIPTKSKHLEGTVAIVSAIAGKSLVSHLSLSTSEEEEREEVTISNSQPEVLIRSQIKNRRRSDKPMEKNLSWSSLKSYQPIDESEEFTEIKRQLRNKRRYEKPKSNSLIETTKSESPTNEMTKLSSCSSEEECKTSTTRSPTKTEQKEKTSKLLQKKHEILLEKLKELSEGENLETWLNSLSIPKEVNVPEMRVKIVEFLKERFWEKNNSKWLLDGSITKRLWADFKELSTAKQILIIIGISVLIAVVGFLTMQLLSFVWPGLLGLATSGEGILVEIGVEAFKQRQEPAFHLLLNHAEQAKPLTTAWANQYVLWKYMRH